jgi:putative spermidine/putrescine transport system permease protein
MGQVMTAARPLHVRIESRRRAFYRLLLAFFVLLQVIWIGSPLLMAVLWSLVDPQHPWTYPQLFPQGLSLYFWRYVFSYTQIVRAIATSYSIAPLAVLVTFVLALPTSYVLGRRPVRGKKLIMILVLLPIIMPGMVIALFLSRVFAALGLAQTFAGLVLGHALLGLPYMIRVLTASFSAISQDVIDAAENLGAGTLTKIKDVFIPMVQPGLVAGVIFVFVTSLEEFNLTFVIGTPTFQTIPTILYSFLGYNFVRTNASVVALLLMIPNIVVLFLVERFIKSDYLSSALGKM